MDDSEQFRLLLENVEDYAIFLLDTQGIISRWNIGAERILGFTEAEALGMPADVIFTPEDREKKESEREIEIAKERGRAVDERWHLRRDGSRFWASGILTALRDETGNLQGFAKILRDFTGRRQAEEDRQAERARLLSVIETMPSGVILAEAPSGRLLHHNQKVEELLGHPFLPAKSAREYGNYGAIHADNSPFAPEEYPIARCLQTGESVSLEEMRYRRGDGTLACLSVHAAPIRDAAGNLTEVVATFHDISARRTAEAEREKAVTALRVAYEREHKIAETLQQSLLLAPSLERLNGLHVEPFYQPALDEAFVGGDFFDAFPLDGRRIALVVGDASGKGLAAAARTAEVKFALRAFLHEYPYPARTLARVNGFLCTMSAHAQSDRETFVALTLVVIDPVNGEVLYAVAGAEPPCILRAGCSAEALPGAGMPLGVDPDAEYSVLTVRLAPGDTMLLVTDGLTEARARRVPGAMTAGGRPAPRALLGYDGLLRLAENACALPSLKQMGRSILSGAQAFAGGTLQDDACLLLARLK